MKRYTIAGMILSFVLGALVVIFRSGAESMIFHHAAHLVLAPMRPFLHAMRFRRRF